MGIGSFDYQGSRTSFHKAIKWITAKDLTHNLSWNNALLVLFDFANYNEDQMLELALKIENHKACKDIQE